MKPKKNPKADLRRKSFLFFQLGMIVMLFAAWQAMEWKSNEAVAIVDSAPTGQEIENQPPITMPFTPPPPPPPPPPPAPPVIEVVDDDDDVKEIIIGPTESNQDDVIAKINDIVEVDDDVIVEVPFKLIEDAPVFPGCEGASNRMAMKKCMEEKIGKFVNKKFNTDLASDLGLEGRQRIFVVFKIDVNGDIVGVQARATHPMLEKEATRVVKLLPDMTPGKQRGVPVIVSYSLPIVFDIQN